MTEEIYPICSDEGALGVRLEVIRRPSGCPGLGGWKKDQNGHWWTRVKGDAATLVWARAEHAPEHCVTLTIDGDRIVGVDV